MKVNVPTLQRDVVIVACAISAGIHGALAPEHFEEGRGAGGGFVAATVVLALLALALTRWADTKIAAVVAAFTFAALIVAYVLAVTTGFPVLHPEVESPDRLAVVTKAIEAAGLLAALAHVRYSQPKGRLHEAHA